MTNKHFENKQQDELLDLVDEHNQVINTILRSQASAQKLCNTRAVHAFIQNSEGKLLIPTRSLQELSLPGALDFSISGCILSGETYEQGFAREAQEEMALDINDFTYELLHIYNPTQEKEATSFCALYRLESNSTPAFNTDDFSGVTWMTPEEVITTIAQGMRSKKMIKPVIERFFLW